MRTDQPIEVRTAMCQDLRNIFAISLCARYLNSTVNLFDGRLHLHQNRLSKAATALKVIVIYNTMSVFA